MLSRTRFFLREISDSNPSSSAGRKVVRGIVYGGLAGGLCGLAIEMTPEEYGLKKKTHAWFETAKRQFESVIKVGSGPTMKIETSPGKHPVPSNDTLTKATNAAPKETPLVPSKGEQITTTQPKNTRGADAVLSSQSKELTEETDTSVKSDDDEELHDVSTSAGGEGEEEPVVDITTKPESAEISGEDEISSNPESPIVDEFHDAEETHPVESETEPEPHEDPTVLLQSEIASLRTELSRIREEHNEDMAKAAGATQATLDTLDRLFNERETAVSVAKHGLLVNEVLYALALDKSSTSAGALRVDLERRLDDLIVDCFTPPQEEATFFKLVFGRLLAWFYNPRAGGFLKTIQMSGSPTWENLCAVEVARSAVDRGDFSSAVTHLEMLEHSESAKEWIAKAKQAQRLWQGAEAAVASMHDDLSKVVLS